MRNGQFNLPIDLESAGSSPAGVSRRDFYFWIRKLHLYLGLFISPYVLVFAVSTLFLNHDWKLQDEVDSNSKIRKFSRQIEVPERMGSLEQAEAILHQLRVIGEISFISYLPKEKRLIIPVMKPGQQTTVEIDLQTQIAVVQQRQTSLWEELVYLHKSPGPHNASIRGNWLFTRLWSSLADSVVYVLLFLSTGGIYLWAVIKAERKSGLILIGSGMASFILIALALSI